MDDIYYEPIEETSLAELLLEDIRRVAIHEAQHVIRNESATRGKNTRIEPAQKAPSHTKIDDC